MDDRLHDKDYLLGWSAALNTERVTFAEWADRHDHQTEGRTDDPHGRAQNDRERARADAA